MSLHTEPAPIAEADVTENEDAEINDSEADVPEAAQAEVNGAVGAPRANAPHTAPHRRRWVKTTVVIALCLLLAAAVYAVTFAPGHFAQSRAERLDGVATADVGSGVQVVPGEGWVVQPRVTNMVEWPPLPPLHNVDVMLGAETGIELLSPDRGLSVELFAAAEPAESDADWLANVAQAESGAKKPTVLKETLASGAGLSHADAPGEIRAVVTLGDERVRVLARTAPAGDAGASKGEAGPINAYRPALSALLESLTAG